MDRQERIDLILDHYENPRFLGPLEPADVVYSSDNPGCGDLVTVHLQVAGDETTALSFQGQGCTISQATASMVMEIMQGWTLGQIDAASAESILGLVGPEIAAARPRCATLALNAVKEASRLYRQRQMVKLIGSQQG
jgi:nitrogen fixation NifU-like protein